jgi:predicted NAD/FAD-binding protein
MRTVRGRSSQRHAVTVYEQAERVGGHSNTVAVPDAADTIPVDTGFIVYNQATYPNLVALFDHLGVATKPSDMSFAVSLDDGRLEYSGSGLAGLLAQPQNLLRPRLVDAAIRAIHWLASRDAARPIAPNLRCATISMRGSAALPQRPFACGHLASS